MDSDNVKSGFFMLLIGGFLALALAGNPAQPTPPGPTPGPSVGLTQAMMIYESSDLETYPREWFDTLFSRKAGSMRDYLDKHTPAGHVLVLDKDNTKLDYVDPKFKPAFAAEAGKPMPRFIITNGKQTIRGKLRNKQADTVAQAQKLGGA